MKTIKQLREEQCYTQAEIAKKIGMDGLSNYSRIENLKQKPRMATRRKLAEVFGVNPSEIQF